MTSPKDSALTVDSVLIVEPRRGPATIDPKYKVIIGTSGSTDYLRDAALDQYHPTRQDRRFWHSSIPRGEPAPDDGQTCDGLHDEGAPTQYLCTRCFPDLRGDLAEPQDDEYDESRRDDHEEME